MTFVESASIAGMLSRAHSMRSGWSSSFVPPMCRMRYSPSASFRTSKKAQARPPRLLVQWCVTCIPWVAMPWVSMMIVCNCTMLLCGCLA